MFHNTEKLLCGNKFETYTKQIIHEYEDSSWIATHHFIPNNSSNTISL